MTQRLNVAASTVLDASGRGRVELGPGSVPGAPYWTVTRVVVGTNRPGQSPVPTLDLYLDTEDAGGWEDTTYDGSKDASDVSIPMQRGQVLIAVWEGGQAGDVATLSVSGTKGGTP